jgi:hypothetical protein
MAHEVEPLVRGGSESRARDERLHEPPADDEPTPDARIAGEDRPMPGLLALDEVEARSQLAMSLRPSAFPADRDVLHAVALEEHASPDVLEALESLPAGRAFVNVQQVWEALGGERERRDTAAGETAAPGEAEAPGAAVDGAEEARAAAELEIEVELNAQDEHVPEVVDITEAEADEVAEPAAASAAPGGPGERGAPGELGAQHDAWWAAPVRAGVGVATIPLKVGASVLRFARDRIRN